MDNTSDLFNNQTAFNQQETNNNEYNLNNNNNRNNDKTKKKQILSPILFKILIIINIILLLVICGFAFGIFSKSPSKNYIEDKTIQYLKENIKHTGNFQINEINYEQTFYYDKDYEFWCTYGKFSAENLYGSLTKYSFEVLIRYDYKLKQAYKYAIYIDDKLIYLDTKFDFE